MAICENDKGGNGVREIKFNFYDTLRKKYIRWGDSNGGMSMSAFITHEYLKFLQYTGLKDKNGREIYEGDILTDYGDEGPIFVEFSMKHAGFVFVDKFDAHGPTLYTPKEISYEIFEVIGNIYENPELLEGAAG